MRVDADDLLGYCGQIRADDAGRAAEWAEHHAGAGDERCLASGGQGPGNIPGVSSDQTHLTNGHTAPLGNRTVGLRRRLEMTGGIG